MKSTESASGPTPPARPPPPPALRRESRALRAGLVVSAILHVLAVALYPLVMDGLRPVAVPVDPLETETVLRGIEVVDVTEVADAGPPDAPEVALDAPAISPSPPAVEAPEEDEEELPRPPGPLPTVVERLQPRLGDPRLWVPMDPEATALTDRERAELMLRGMLETWNDSVAVAAALSERARDWTYTDDEGRRWGLSPGRLHLGDFSIPLPFSLQGQSGFLEDRIQREWQIEDLMRAAQSAAIRETWAERAREIRRRLEEERSRPPDGDGARR